MGGGREWTMRERVDGYVGWWSDAGVDWMVDDTPASWFEQKSDVSETAVPLRREGVREAAPEIVSAPVQAFDAGSLPSTLAELHALLAQSDALPGTNLGLKKIALVANEGAKLAVFVDMPSREDIETGSLLSGAEGALLDAILRAVGMKRDECALVPLAVTRPASGHIAGSDLPGLKMLGLHHLKLAKPRHVVLLGQVASSLLSGEDLLQGRGKLHKINHDSGEWAAMTSFHPRTLLAKPQLKAEAWRDWQMLKKEFSS